MANFDVELNDEVENFTVEFGEVQRITVDDFDKLRNRPSYAGQTMTHETNIPEVPTAVSQLTNDADYQTGSEVESAISTAVGGEKDAREQADAGLSRDIGVVDGKVDAEADARERADIALQGAIDDEETARKNADNGLQGQIDAITSSSDVVDIVGTYAELLQYPTAGLGDKDVVKVLQDETHNDAMSYYRWNKSSSTWSYIGSEGPYYTKSETNTLLGDKQDTLTTGSNITISSNNTISATDTTYTAGNGLTLTGTEFSADTTVLQPKLTAGDGINISAQNVISADIDPADFFTASETVDGTGSEITLNNTIQAKIKSVQMDGDTYQQTYSGKNLFDKSNYIGAYRATYTEMSNGLKATATATGGAAYVSISIPNSDDLLGKTARLSIGNKVSHDGSNLNVVVYQSSGGSTVSGSPILTLSGTAKEGTCTFPSSYSGNSNQFVIIFYCQGDTVNAYSEYTNIQLELGSSTTPYEPYTGGIPAPNPDYPQPIQVVTGEQTVGVTGKNLFNKNSVTSGYYLDQDGSSVSAANWVISDYMPVIAGESYSYSGIRTSGIAPYSAFYDKNKQLISTFHQVNHAETITIPSQVAYVRFSIFNGSPSDVGDFQLEKGSATAYEPYQGATYTIDLGATELCKIGDYQDYIYESGDDWYVHKAVRHLQLPISGMNNSESNPGWTGQTQLKTDLGTTSGGQIYTDTTMVTNIAGLVTSESRSVTKNFNGSNALLLLPAGYYGYDHTQTYWQTNYAGLVVDFYYGINGTITDTKITDATLISELNALADALGYKDKTIITVSATGTNLPAILEVSAYRNSLAGVLGVIGRAEAA